MAQMTSLEMLEKLVGFDTTSHRSNLPLIEWVEGFLADHGVASTRLPNEDGTKANLYAHIGPMVEGGVILSGHTDVVPVKGQAWDTDPWVVTEVGGKYFGRGTCDMKGFLAQALAHVPDMMAADLQRPIQLALSFDEEVGCEGVIPMVHALAGNVPKADLCIVGEPSLMKVVTGHKGSIGYDTHVHGFEVHSSLVHKGVSAIMNAARLIEWHRETMAANAAAANPEDPYVPPYTTLHVGTINGGTAGNITAKDCEFMTDIRIIPGESDADWDARYRAFAAELSAEMQQIHPDTGVEVKGRINTPALEQETDGTAEALCRRLTGDNSTNVVSYQTEAGHFQRAGFSTAICGPGSIEQAHQPNEFITKDQFDQGGKFIRDLISHLSD